MVKMSGNLVGTTRRPMSGRVHHGQNVLANPMISAPWRDGGGFTAIAPGGEIFIWLRHMCDMTAT
jgi:hypothetical protein